MFCHEFFPSTINNWKCHCEKESCKKAFQTIVMRIKKSRNMNAEYFDVYDDQYPINYGKFKTYERVCRVCGKRLLNKDGKYMQMRRYCSDHNGNIGRLLYNWNSVQYRALRHNREEIENKDMIESWKRNFDLENKLHFHQFNVCDNCGCLCRSDGYWQMNKEYAKLPGCEVHHIKPVYTLTEDNLNLIFDLTNLQVLCLDCHNLTKKRKVEPKPTRIIKYHNIETYFGVHEKE